MRHILETAFLAVSSLLVAIATSWLLLVSVNFSYPVWLQYAGINEAIDLYGPENIYKNGFHKTTQDQRIELFDGIVHAVHSGGEGLDLLSFKVDGEPVQALLTELEVIHLQDVANLIDVGMVVAMIAVVAWLCAWGYLIYFQRKIPPLIKQIVVVISLIAVASLVVVVLGTMNVFYALHTMVFPDGHQWFFYYEDSLMATLMFAPYLFGWIALELLVLTIPICIGLQYLGVYLSTILQSHSSASQ